jgi:hypothetical protein
MINNSTLLDVLDLLLASTVTPLFRDEIGRVIINVSPRRKSIKRVTRRYLVTNNFLILGEGREGSRTSRKSRRGTNKTS